MKSATLNNSQIDNKITNDEKKRTLSKLKVSVIALSLAATSIAPLQVQATDNNAYQEQATHVEASEFSAKEKEHIGFGVGAVVGAVIGGPIGAVVTGVFGNIVAKNINANDEITELKVTLEDENEAHQYAITQYEQQLDAKLTKLEQHHQAELFAMEQAYQSTKQIKAKQLLMSLQFSTGSSEIAPHYQEQVAVLAQLLQSDPELSIDLSGYTDLQGDEALNQNLSNKRVETVKNLLMAQGVDANRIQTYAYGDTAPLVANETNKVSFYDRRVVLQVKANGGQMAKN